MEEALRHDIPATMASLSAFNRWLEEDWGFSYRDRLLGVPMLSLADPDAALDGTASFYYLRVRDEGLHAIWTSPVWVNFQDSITDAPAVVATQVDLALAASPKVAR